MTLIASPLLLEFGTAVRRARGLKGWQLDDLATRIVENQRGNSGTKTKPPSRPFLSDVEKGKRAISPPTVGKLIRALDLPESWMDRFLDSDTAPDSEETAQDRDAERLMLMLERDAPAVPPAEALLIGLAQDFAGKPFFDHFSAYASLKQALSDAADLKAQGLLPSNTGDQLSLILRRVSDLNDQGLRDEAGEELEAAISRNEAEAEALFNAALKQDRVRNRPEDAARRLIANLHRLAPAGRVVRATHDLIFEWRERGETQGLLFDLNVALHMAKHSNGRAKGSMKGPSFLSLGLCQLALGRRSIDIGYLIAAMNNVSSCLKLVTRTIDPDQWAKVQNTLGNILQQLGDRQADVTLIEQSIEAYTRAANEWTQMKALHDWAMAQNNMSNALHALGEHQRDVGQIRLAITTLNAALQVRTQSALPKDWATTQNNLGVAHRWLADLTREVAALDDAAKAHDLCLQEWKKEDVPFNWAITQWNLADLALLRYDFTPDPAYLVTARGHALAAREVFALGSDHQTARCDDLLARIEALSAGGAVD